MPIVIYGIDGANNKVETLTKEQILDAIAQAQQGMPILDYDSAFVSQIKEINHGDALKFWIGTQAEYNAITPKAANVLYIISDDNSKEEIIAAIDALSSSISGISTALQNKQDVLTFDTAPTQNSANPVTSGGIYTAIQNSGARRTVLWTRSSISSLELTERNDYVTLADSVANYDYLEVHIRVLQNDTQEVNSISKGIQTFKANNGGKICVAWNFLTLESYISPTRALFRSYEATLKTENNQVTVTDCAGMRSDFFSTNVNTFFDTGVAANIYQIVGVKIQ